LNPIPFPQQFLPLVIPQKRTMATILVISEKEIMNCDKNTPPERRGGDVI